MKRVLHILLIAIFALQAQAQERKVKGTITDNSGLPLPGVNVIVKNTSNGTQSDFDGNYELQVNVGQTLVYTYVGFVAIEKKISNSTYELNIIMEEDAAVLEEVVVTAYGTRKMRRSLSYAIRSISSKSKSRKLSGKTAGVQVTNSNGLPGSSQKVIIRGMNSLGNSNILNDESYAEIQENAFKSTKLTPLSTFSIDVDKAGYSNLRRIINNGQEIPKDAVKVEEMINYFNYNYEQPKGDHPFSINTEIASSPWNKNAKLVRIGLKGKDISSRNLPNSNLVFLLDVSGSMDSQNKLPLLKASLRVLLDQLREQDKVSIVVYAGAAGVVLKPTSGNNKDKILSAINNLNAGGSTAGGQGIELAYKIAQENFIKGGNNRIVLATDGDFNVGASSDRSMEELIIEKRKHGIFLTVLGFGMGNYKDSKMETLADKGNGNHAYIDTMQEARKVLGEEFFGTIYTIAKDVKIQVEFNPNKVQAYRLIGYENRLLNDEDFKDDTKDAGELGSGHTVTAFYEVIPVGVKSDYIKSVDDLKYSKTVANNSDELLTVKFRYKKPDGDKSELIVKTVIDDNTLFEEASEDFKFSAAVALFGLQLRDSSFIKTKKSSDVIALAKAGKGKDENGYRSEFIRLVKSL